MSRSIPADREVTALAAQWRDEGCGLLMLQAAVKALAGDDPARYDNPNLLGDTVAIHTQLEALRSVWLNHVAEIDRREAATEEEGAASTASWLRGSCLIPGSQAAAAVRVARRLPALPHVAEALGEGRIGFDAAKLLTRALNRSRLEAAEAAPDMTAEKLESALVKLAEIADPVLLRGKLREVTDQLDALATDGTDGKPSSTDEPASSLYASRTLDDVVHVSGRFDAVDGAVLLTALDSASAPLGPEDKRTPGERRAAALLDLIDRALNGGELPANGGERPHVAVLVPCETLFGHPGPTPESDAGPAGRALQELLGVISPDDAPNPTPEPPGVPVVEFFGLDRPDTASALMHSAPGNPARRSGNDAQPGGGARCKHLNRLLGNITTRPGIGSGPSAWLTHTGPISREMARLLACDSIVHRIVLGPDSIPLDVGRSVRIVPAPLRRALLVRDQGCAFPGCDRPPSWCQAHHIKHFADGGETSLDNCVLLCRFHHWLIHHKGWGIHAVPGGRPYFTRPGGTRIEPPELPRAG